MVYTVEQVMSITGQKQGTVEAYRVMLQEKGVLGKNKPLDEQHLRIFTKICSTKTDSETWQKAMERGIQTEYGEVLTQEFHWVPVTKLRHLHWLIQEKKVHKEKFALVEASDREKEHWHAIFEIMIGNFAELGKVESSFDGSFGTDANACIHVLVGKDFIYYLVGRRNSVTNREELAVFYNRGIEFNVMNCEFICCGAFDEGWIKEIMIALKDLQ